MEKNPDAYRTIGEAAEELNLPQHVLRFWETRFSQISPMKRSGGRRYYRPGDVQLLAAIQHLLYGEGYTIKGVQRILKQQGTKAIVGLVDQLKNGEGPNDAALVLHADPSRESEGRVDQAGAASSSAEARQPEGAAHWPVDAPAAAHPASAAGPNLEQPNLAQPNLPAYMVKLLEGVLVELDECSRALEAARGH